MLLCGSGFYIAWYMSLQSVRHSQKNLIATSTFKSDKVVSFVFAKKDFQKNEEVIFNDEDEFEYNNQMYDVINKKIVGDSIYISCISDKQEDNLRDVAITQILNASDNSTGKQLPIFNFRLDHYTNNLFNNESFFLKSFMHFYIKYNDSKLVAPFLAIFSPPPRFIA